MKLKWLFLFLLGMQLGCSRIIYLVDMKNLSGGSVIALDINDEETIRLQINDSEKFPIPGDWVIRVKRSDSVYYYDAYDLPQNLFHPKAIGLKLNAKLNTNMTLECENGTVLIPKKKGSEP